MATFENKKVEITEVELPIILAPSQERMIHSVVGLAEDSTKRKWCSKHQASQTIDLAKSCKDSLTHSTPTESLSDVIASKNPPKEKLADIVAKSDENIIHLYHTCLAQNALSFHYNQMLNDHTTTPETHDMIIDLALKMLLPKIHCLRAQARYRSEIRSGFNLLIESILENDIPLMKQLEMDVEMNYQRLEKCKNMRCGGEWTECCTLSAENPAWRVCDWVSRSAWIIWKWVSQILAILWPCFLRFMLVVIWGSVLCMAVGDKLMSRDAHLRWLLCWLLLCCLGILLVHIPVISFGCGICVSGTQVMMLSLRESFI